MTEISFFSRFSDGGIFLKKLLITIGLFLLLPGLSFGSMSVFADIVINEIYPKPDDKFSAWIELYNNGTDQSVDGWKLQNSSGTFVIPGGTMIPAGRFFTFDKSQTALNLSEGGDTIWLFDQENHAKDNQSYQGILGFNNSVGRNTDGGGSWVVCADSPPVTPANYYPTKNEPNKCPPAPVNTPTPAVTVTPIPLPSYTPVPTPVPSATSIVQPTSTPFPTSAFEAAKAAAAAQSQVLGMVSEPTVTPVPPIANVMQDEARWSLGVAALFIGGGLGLLAVTAGIHTWSKRRRSI